MTKAAARSMGLCASLAVVAWLGGCVGPIGGVGEGEPCSGDDCASNLTCQPILGRSQDYCCPAPASMSHKSQCQAAPTGGDGG